jgi:hypothetical protein
VDSASVADLQNQNEESTLGNLNDHSEVADTKSAVRDPDETTKQTIGVRLELLNTLQDSLRNGAIELSELTRR